MVGVSNALLAYLVTVLPQVRKELRRCRGQAEAISDPQHRRFALEVLEEKASNVEGVAVFATLAPWWRRRAVLRTIVPLQIRIDYLDSLEERGAALSDGDGAYLDSLRNAWLQEFEMLPASRAVMTPVRRAIERCCEGQRHTHAAAGPNGSAILQAWAEDLGVSGYQWWEVAAGASSSVAVHVLIAAAANPRTTADEAAVIDATYFLPIGALTVLLDDAVDREHDRTGGDHNYLDYYENMAIASERVGVIAERATRAAGRLPGARRHLAILAGIGAFYAGDAGFNTPQVLPIRDRLLKELGIGAHFLTRFTRTRWLPHAG